MWKHGKKHLARVFFMNIGANSHSYIYQVFIGAYLINYLDVDSKLIPKFLLIGALCACVSAVLFGILSDQFGRKRMYLIVTGFLMLFAVPAFLILNTGNLVLICLVIVVGFMIASQGTVGVQAAYFPELFGSRYRYAGVALGREFSSVFGGGLAPFICAALITWATGSWWPVAVYMVVIMGITLRHHPVRPRDGRPRPAARRGRQVMPATPTRIVITDCDHDSIAIEQAVADAAGVDLVLAQCRTEEDVIAAAAGADAIVVQYAPVTDRVLAALPQLKAIGRYGVGVDTLDVEAATARGVAVCNVPDYGTEDVSDHAIALAVSLARGITPWTAACAAGSTRCSPVEPLHRMSTRVFGVVGLGLIGAATARKAKGLGYTVIVFDPLAGNWYDDGGWSRRRRV